MGEKIYLIFCVNQNVVLEATVAVLDKSRRPPRPLPMDTYGGFRRMSGQNHSSVLEKCCLTNGQKQMNRTTELLDDRLHNVMVISVLPSLLVTVYNLLYTV